MTVIALTAFLSLQLYSFTAILDGRVKPLEKRMSNIEVTLEQLVKQSSLANR